MGKAIGGICLKILEQPTTTIPIFEGGNLGATVSDGFVDKENMGY